MTIIVFWISLTVLFYIYFGYPFLLWVMARYFSAPIKKNAITPTLSFIVVAHNEEKIIAEKLENILSLDYPRGNLEIMIGSDGSTDSTDKIVESYKDRGVKLFSFNDHNGKVGVLNKVVGKATGEIIVFSDARQKFDINALKELAANFADEKVGCVSGELVFSGEKESGVASGVGFYWKYEKLMRLWEGKLNSMIGATGAIYAIRRNLFVPPKPDTILDDVFIPLQVVRQGYRSIFDGSALAFDKVAETSREEFTRKVRTLAGNFQLFIRCFGLFNPFKSKIAWQFFSHKFLRAFGFVFLISFFASNIALLPGAFYKKFFIAQIIFYGLALWGWAAEYYDIKSKFLSFPYSFCVLNLAAFKGFLRFIFGRQKVTWERAAHSAAKSHIEVE